MLTHLRIQNFALIDQLSIQLNKGFTVLTGETGSGKSILLQALNLLLGERADFSVIGAKGDKSVVEGEFDLTTFHLKSLFDELDVEFEECTIIRREISKQGKSRAFINDSPVQMNVLKAIVEKIIHIHSQHQTLELKRSGFQIELLDLLGGYDNEIKKYKVEFNQFQQKLKIEKQLNEELTKAIQSLDYNQFQLTELEELNLEQTDFENLESELERIEKADEIKDVLHSTNLALESEGGILSVLNKIKQSFDRTRVQDNTLQDIKKRIESVQIELKELASECEDYIDRLESNPEKAYELTQKLDKYNRVLTKHGLKSKEELLAYQESLSLDVTSVGEIESNLLKVQKEIKIQQEELNRLAEQIHQKRKTESSKIAASIQGILEDLKMPSTEIEFSIEKLDQLTINGFDQVELKFSPNKGIKPVAIDKAASGGELSRFMLAVQQLISKKKQLPTLIFDEIDTGVSGEVAQKIGVLLKKMGDNMQMLAITHLPQVAAKASFHFKVQKNSDDAITKTSVFELKGEEKVIEVARLMSGEKVNEAALLNAKELMS